jgi:hypothetical protein
MVIRGTIGRKRRGRLIGGTEKKRAQGAKKRNPASKGTCTLLIKLTGNLIIKYRAKEHNNNKSNSQHT